MDKKGKLKRKRQHVLGSSLTSVISVVFSSSGFRTATLLRRRFRRRLALTLGLRGLRLIFILRRSFSCCSGVVLVAGSSILGRSVLGSRGSIVILAPTWRLLRGRGGRGRAGASSCSRSCSRSVTIAGASSWAPVAGTGTGIDLEQLALCVAIHDGGGPSVLVAALLGEFVPVDLGDIISVLESCELDLMCRQIAS